ncbi:dnaJ homolog subfamily C member 13-like isoform X3 [Branchiostoma floridae]|uniref:DnaJ homolog subfamily C member 13-like isoform X3 n=1 Tax=Branchiostoma floridae TaxID=7739 RepID=A0A9J7HNN4_BRAFL|nr:dnaJ homolog subfamily C member 13-like isoform X3 [Branchiostoma floridae]
MADKTVLVENKDVASYFTTKHSWRGKYKRIFSVGTKGITTYNPQTLEVTNQWAYSDFVSILPSPKAASEFIITMKKQNKKNDSMRFSTDYRADLITEALRFRKQFADSKAQSEKRFNAYKHHWSDNRVQILLEVTAGSLNQVDPATNKVLCSYDYKDMEGVIEVSDYPGGFCLIYGGFSRLHLFASDKKDDIIKAVMEHAGTYVGLTIKRRKDPIVQDQFTSHRLGKYSGDEHITSLAEFVVQKHSQRHSDPVKRIFCLTETCIVERDPASYSIITLRPLCDVFAIVRSQVNPQVFTVEYVKGATRQYSSTDRDTLIASMLDGVRASGNRDVCVKMTPTDRGQRLGPLFTPVDEEVESLHLKFLQQPPNAKFSEAVYRFNNNVSYSGLLHAVTADGFFAENKEKLIHIAITVLLEREGDQTTLPAEDLESQFHALRRLVASKAGFCAFTTLPKFREKVGLKVVKALKRNDTGVIHAAIDMMGALMQPMHDDYDLRQEQLNKASILSSKKFLQSLLDVFAAHVPRGTGALVISAMLDFLTFALCAPYSETTDGTYFDSLLQMVADMGRSIFKLFQHPSMAIVKGAGLVMKAIIEEGDQEIAAKMQDLALAEGALLKHLHIAMFTASKDNRMVALRQLSRHLVGLWVTGAPTAMGLLKRIVPTGLLGYLDSEDQVPQKEVDLMHVRDNVKIAQDQSQRRKPQWKQVEELLLHWRARIGLNQKELSFSTQDPRDAANQKPIVLRKRRQRIKSEANWLLFYYQFNRDHARSNLLWNYKTREELRDNLEAEIRAFNVDKELGSTHTISWNHSEFEVRYECLNEEIKIGEYYLRLLLEEDDNEDNSQIKRSYEFFNDLYHRFLLTPKVQMKCMCLQAMTIVYGRCYEEIGTFNDTKYMVGMLERCTDRQERDRLVLFLNKLILNKRNVKELMDANGVKILVDLLTLAHLHTSRAVVPTQTNVIEASPDMMRESEKEWYYGNADKERLGPYSINEMKDFWEEGVITAKTRCWAQGMDGWRPLHNIPQLKWCLLATSQAVMNESELATLILNMLIRICEYYPSRDPDGAIIRPLPRAKRLVAETTCLPHIVQLLLTFDPVLVEKVATVMWHIMQDNPQLPRLYLSGVFFFIMMYTGSNIVPVARFLKYTHTQQAFRAEDAKSSDIMQRSILGQILPEAMVHYLENYGAEKFSEIFLGEFDTPEAIWSSEMRRMMIEKIAAHIADFSPRLQSNTRALYQYCPIPHISYPPLENELFCNIYYLRNLCNTTKFPDWPIKEPVKLLKDILEAWKSEVEKKPPSMSVEEAYDVLNLPKGEGGHEEGKIRKAYFRLAQKYHPDKNPEGREMFEKVNKAYEFLCSKSSQRPEGPDPMNIVLILQSQSILFKRYRDVLAPYKYAGYPMLIKTIRMETGDDQLFSKSAPLLTAASELAFHTVNCSALNAEELRRENGIEVLQEAFSRCISVLSKSSKPDDLAVQVCMHISRCYAVAAQFEGCREKIIEIPAIIKDLCRILYYKDLPRMCSVATECVSAFCVDYYLQNHLLQAGVLWHLLLYLFHYDYTLEEGGVEKSDESNQQSEFDHPNNLQEVANNLARLSMQALARLGGYLDGDQKTPDNPAVKRSIAAMLTPYLSRQLNKDDPREVLKILNSNTENPYLIWDNGTRMELTEFLQTQQSEKIRTGECDPSYGADFCFTIHEKELQVGEIYVRVYNEQPTFPLEDAKGFTRKLIDFLGSQAEYLHSLLALSQGTMDTTKESNKQRLRDVEMALEALRNVIRNNPGTEVVCLGHFRLLFALLRLHGAGKLQQLALEVVNSVTTNQDCVNDIADASVLPYLLLVIQSLPTSRSTVLESLHALLSSTKIVKEALARGALIYLLDLFCNSTNPGIRGQTAELFSKMIADKLVGPKIRIILSKFLPGIFMDAMRDSPEAAVHMFEGTHENPELIWNDDAREKVSSVVKKMKDTHYAAQKENIDAGWKLPEDFAVVYTDVEGELTVGGVFLRLFISQPGWVLRKPKEFQVSLTERWIELTSKNNPDGEVLETLTTAVVSLFTAQPQLADNAPGLGHIPQVFKPMSSRNSAIPKSALLVAHVLANNDLCVTSMSQTDCIRPMMVAMRARPDMIGIACETFFRMFEKDQTDLVKQAIEADLVQYLLRLLDGGLEQVENPAGTKAQIVKSLKAMTRSLEYGEQVQSVLDKSTVWTSYRDQKHDLFISQTATAGYLTGGEKEQVTSSKAGPSVAGYLTAGTSAAMPDKPPPMVRDEDLQGE